MQKVWIIQPKPTEAQKLCNCLVKEDCPINGLRLTSSILYQATIKCNDGKYKQKRYKGICETTPPKNDTTLSIEYWNLKQKQQTPKLRWGIKDSIRLITPLRKNVTFA